MYIYIWKKICHRRGQNHQVQASSALLPSPSSLCALRARLKENRIILIIGNIRGKANNSVS